MQVIVFEGYDNRGKSTIINQLKEKYKERVGSFAFPTQAYRDMMTLTYEGRLKSLDNFLQYHGSFLNDFDEQQEFLSSLKCDLLLLDRYYFSHCTYMQYDSQTVFGKIDSKQFYPGNFEIYNQFKLQPSKVIYLYGNGNEDNDDELRKRVEIEECYNEVFNHYQFFNEKNPVPIHRIKALQPTTFDEVDKVVGKMIS